MIGAMRSIGPASTLFLISGAAINGAIIALFLALIIWLYGQSSFPAGSVIVTLFSLGAIVYCGLNLRLFVLALMRAGTVRIVLNDGRLEVAGCATTLTLGPDDVAAYYFYSNKIVLTLAAGHPAGDCAPFLRLKNSKLTIRTSVLQERATLNRMLQDFDARLAEKTDITLGSFVSWLSP